MNCKHCKAQWTPPAKASISSCPFCGKPLVDPADLGTDTKPEIILKQVIERFDLAILGEKRLSAILKDLMPQLERKYQRIFTQAVNDGVGAKLLELTTASQAVRTASLHTLKENFRQHNGFDHSASYVIDCFLYALGWVERVDEQETHIGINPIKLLNQQIELAFADKILTSDEAKLLFQSAQGLGISVEEVAKAIEKKIKELKLQPKVEHNKNLNNSKDIICSTDWIAGIEIDVVETIKSVKIGNQIWMAENLKVAHFRNGDPIPEAKTDEEWKIAGEQGKPAWCYYENDPKNGKKYGKLYNWYAVNDPRGIAPEGWHIPSDDEWSLLINFAGGKSIAGEKLKATIDWIENGNGTDDFGFFALPGGRCKYNGIFDYLGRYGFWWSSTENDNTGTLSRNLSHNLGYVGRNSSPESWGFSVRCLKDTKEEDIKEAIIGNQTWMAENLNVAHFSNGEPIPEAKTDEEWKTADEQGKPAWCYYNNEPANGKKYGKLYNWFAVNDRRGLAPKGWRIPTDMDWTILINFCGGEAAAGPKLKATNNWNLGGNGSDEYGFSALPMGGRYYNGDFYDIGYNGYWWSSTENNTIDAWSRIMRCINSGVGRVYNDKRNGFSVRCLTDAIGEKINEVKIGNQIWMAENLNVAHFRNGDPLPEAKTDEEWKLAGEQGKPAWCYYDNDPVNGEKYGRLYNWFAVNDPRGLAPEGWYVPCNNDWSHLTDFLGGLLIAGKKLKAKSNWYMFENGSDNYKFSALPGSGRNIDGTFLKFDNGGIWEYTPEGYRFNFPKSYDIGYHGHWWCSNESNFENAWTRSMDYNNVSVVRGKKNKRSGFSVRCLKG